jgi:hypothetical protein
LHISLTSCAFIANENEEQLFTPLGLLILGFASPSSMCDEEISNVFGFPHTGHLSNHLLSYLCRPSFPFTHNVIPQSQQNGPAALLLPICSPCGCSKLSSFL